MSSRFLTQANEEMVMSFTERWERTDDQHKMCWAEHMLRR